MPLNSALPRLALLISLAAIISAPLFVTAVRAQSPTTNPAVQKEKNGAPGKGTATLAADDGKSGEGANVEKEKAGLAKYVELFLHLDKTINSVFKKYGTWTYAILFAIIFCETGLVVTPFLPGDSLLFAAGALAHISDLSLWWMIILLSIAAIIGDTVNYWIGHFLGEEILKYKLVKQKHLDRTHEFFEKYGGKTIVIARFVPIVRTVAPFVAGLGSMNYRRFIIYNIAGGLAWVISLTMFGYFFGGFKIVKDHFSIVTLAIIVISVLPLVYEYWNQAIRKRK